MPFFFFFSKGMFGVAILLLGLGMCVRWLWRRARGVREPLPFEAKIALWCINVVPLAGWIMFTVAGTMEYYLDCGPAAQSFGGMAAALALLAWPAGALGKRIVDAEFPGLEPK